MPTDFDLVLAYPQWQGSGRSENLRRGAKAAAEVCARYGPLASAPLSGDGEARGGINRWTAILDQFRAARAILAERRPDRVLTAGGDCACDVAVIDHLRRRHPDLTVIWVDAHLDANTAATSPSGNFHGMPVATLMGQAPADLAPLLAPPLDPARFRYVAAQVGDDGEWAFQREKGLEWLRPGERIEGPVHIHFDLDALDPAEFPHLAYPEGRLRIDDGLALVRTVAGWGGLVGLTITEFAPADDEAARDGARVIDSLCRAALGR
ncbi:arginase family protein [Phenylobacterium sp. VNQ135]|uniref:arginase family protein n=1 Tax=Phenylobacterium sp. VNQ135 TaxID=3400922 RepID=UPI003C10EF50